MSDLDNTIFVKHEGIAWIKAKFKGGSSKTIEIQLPDNLRDCLWSMFQSEADKQEQLARAELIADTIEEETKNDNE